ncbi:MarR family winged helix-turn-helix transcriptional regulator [uncultured Methylobacterium sp.]|uniref:MarR family winged helix-turn-helix transcriptional regulator n=1 Tax=uncultured Methylobacterium sp. TaxID=157278 RepID=UPI0035C97AE8
MSGRQSTGTAKAAQATFATNDHGQRLDDQLCFAVYSAAHAFGRAYRALLTSHELTYPQYLVLMVLWEQEGLTVKELGGRLFLDSGTLTPLLKRMEASGHVRRARDRTDERQVSIFLTPKAQALKGKLDCVPSQAGGMSGLNLEARRELLDVLVNLRGSLHDSIEAGPADMA